MNTYKLYLKIRELRNLSKDPHISRKVSWELSQLANELEEKYLFIIKTKELLKCQNVNTVIKK